MAEKNKMNKELLRKLKNREDVLVLYPDIIVLTKNMCSSYNKFIDMITKNEIFIEILNDDSTIDNFFENEL